MIVLGLPLSGPHVAVWSKMGINKGLIQEKISLLLKIIVAISQIVNV